MKVMIHQTMLFMYVHCQLMKSFKAMDMGQNDDVLPEYVQALFPDFTHLYLVVDAENQSAWNVYERAGLCIQLQRRRTYRERKTLLFRFRFKTCVFFKVKRGSQHIVMIFM